MFGLSNLELILMFAIATVSAAIVIWPAARICRRAGFSAWLGIFAVIPIANIALLWFVAMSRWRTQTV